MKLGVVVLNWNGKEVTPRCLDSLLQGACVADRIVVVDNASTDGSVDLIRGRYPGVVLIQNDSNLGFAEGNNVGIRYLLDQGFDLVLLHGLLHAVPSGGVEVGRLAAQGFLRVLRGCGLVPAGEGGP